MDFDTMIEIDEDEAQRILDERQRGNNIASIRKFISLGLRNAKVPMESEDAAKGKVASLRQALNNPTYKDEFDAVQVVQDEEFLLWRNNAVPSSNGTETA